MAKPENILPELKTVLPKRLPSRKATARQATIVGIPPMEDFYMGGASVKLFLPIFKMNFPEIVDLALPAEGVFHNLVFAFRRLVVRVKPE